MVNKSTQSLGDFNTFCYDVLQPIKVVSVIIYGRILNLCKICHILKSSKMFFCLVTLVLRVGKNGLYSDFVSFHLLN